MAAPLVDWHIGRMPLVITCPHDGRAEPPGVPERPDDQAGCLTKKQADLSTRTIALGLSSAVQALMGLEPSMVVARFHRRYIDANRPETCAFVAREARPLYREYHNRITAAIRSTVKQFPRLGILVDIHGAADLSEEPDRHVLLGTDGGKSIARLLELDPRILFRRQGLVRSLQSGGFGVIPANAGDPEHASFDGGFTVQRHGASRASGIDALQIEVVRKVRLNAARRDALIQMLAHGLIRLLARQKILVEMSGR